VILFVRHGETAVNVRGAALGRADPPLTERGEAQAVALGAALRAAGVERIRSSPLQRAVQTATAIADVVGRPVEIDDRLVELDYGEWDEKHWSELPADAVARWRDDPTFAPPGGESLGAVSARVASFCEELAEGPTTIAVSHVSPIKAAVTWALGVSDDRAWRMFLGLASITRVTSRDGAPSLLSFNETQHLL
jgi:probable phosphoglycerate mutase